jgi:hypothetical protein
MSQPFILKRQPEWSVRSMTADQIPLVVSWIAGIDPLSTINVPDLVADMHQEFLHARSKTPSEYYIGFYGQLETFYMVGFPFPGKAKYDSASTKWRNDYEVSTLLVNPALSRELYLPLYHQVVKFLFTREDIGRVLLQIEKTNDYLQSVVSRLGFEPYEYSKKQSVSYGWYACRRADFIRYT